MIAPFVQEIKLKFPTEPQILSLKPKSMESKAWTSKCENASLLRIGKVRGEMEGPLKKSFFHRHGHVRQGCCSQDF